MQPSRRVAFPVDGRARSREGRGRAPDPRARTRFHNLHLPSGHESAPDHPLLGDLPGFRRRELAPALPDDLSGWTALDVGCNASSYSFELARRGAQVLDVDSDEHYLGVPTTCGAR